MNKPWYLMPFIVVYKMVLFVILLPWNMLKILSKGIIIGSSYFYKHIIRNIGLWLMKVGPIVGLALLHFLTALSLCFYKSMHYLKKGFITLGHLLILGSKKLGRGIRIFIRLLGTGILVVLQSLWRILKFILIFLGKSARFFFIGIYSVLFMGKSLLYRSGLSLSVYSHKKHELAAIRKIENQKKKKEQLTEKRLLTEKKKEEKLLHKQQELAEKKQAHEEKAVRKKKENDEYKNEEVVLEKKTFGSKVGGVFTSILRSPITLKNSIAKKYQDSSFVKAARNKRDMNRQALLINFDGEDAVKSDKKILYEYVAKNAEGKVIKDYFEAFSKVEVHSFLLSEGYEVYSIRSSQWISFLHGRSSVNRVKIKTKDLIFFVTQLSTYIKAGIPLAEALKILSRQYKKVAYKKIFSAIIYDLTMGESFSEALTKQGAAFPRLLINMIKTAEMTGELPEALDDMANYYTEADKTRKQMITALMYPTMVFFFAIGVITFILIWVIPQFVTIYESMDASKIPGFTLFVIQVSAFLKKYLLWIILGLIIFTIIFIYLYKNIKMFRTIIQWLAMHIPVLGNVIIYNEVTMFTKTFASLLKHNVFITDSMDILNKITNNEIYKMLILDTITNIAHGDKISLAFKDHWAFPIPAYEMLVTGEKTGQLPDMMAKVSVYYQEMHAQSVARIKTFIEPILIIFLTVMVGIIILAIILPMFGMYDMIQ